MNNILKQSAFMFMCGALALPVICLAEQYNPDSLKNIPMRVLWGDTHLHTSMSPDAFFFGNKNITPDDAYRFAKGQPVDLGNGMVSRLSRPLDFLVVADHAEYLGLLPQLRDGNASALAIKDGERWHDMLNAGDSEAYKAGREILTKFAVNTPLDGDKMKVVLESAWHLNIRSAENANEPGIFTAFAGFEWSSMPGGNNLHRVVMFRDDSDKLMQVLPYSSVDSNDPEDLWRYLQGYEDSTGGKALAIPHNGNVSNGLMFSLQKFNGESMDREYAATRATWEPVVEVTQIKGDSETHPMLSPEDEFADYETWDKVNITASKVNEPWMLQYEYARSALKLGLTLDNTLGVNPFKFGVIGSSDAHTGLSAVAEDNFWGKSFYDLPVPDRTQGAFIHQSGTKYPIQNWQLSASGYAGVWATENTREAIFDAMRRREVYATTGPRMIVRFFGGWDFSKRDVERPDYVYTGYEKGVPMGGDITLPPSANAAPRFMIMAAKDPLGANLDRVQVVKGWLDAKGETHEKVYDAAWSGDRKPDKKGKLPPVGNTVDLDKATHYNTIGAAELATVWEDPDFDAGQRAFYYLRVLEIPTPRWVVYDKVRLGAKLPEDAQLIHQERAYSSPIWYTP